MGHKKATKTLETACRLKSARAAREVIRREREAIRREREAIERDARRWRRFCDLRKEFSAVGAAVQLDGEIALGGV